MNSSGDPFLPSTFVSRSETDTIDLGKTFARQLRSNDIVALFGNLGSGKTRFVQGICNALNVEHNISSPTFTLINEYKSDKGKIFHFDFYRIHSVDEILQLGFYEYLESDGICIIEWAERTKEFLPAVRYDVYFEFGENENERMICIEKFLNDEYPRN
ncbi:MAG: tRNA (adenosine(37)-N6)-threonylcarbamoyltransferase complex ATPase subunit type 1 TsaE [Ignavibacteria bacterium]|nr:tRNA (adenosine(37)-N6)-threonylcarbamoyltransferase complex ATPase subunit type 1 TsaE [Ignavibacteria bacterium]